MVERSEALVDEFETGLTRIVLTTLQQNVQAGRLTWLA
jgi:hypothetical protein